MKFAGLAIAAAALVAGSTGAMANQREAVSVKIETAGVDFTNPAEIATFQRSAERKIADACNPGDRINADLMPDFKCRKQMSANLVPVVQKLALRATEKRMATID